MMDNGGRWHLDEGYTEPVAAVARSGLEHARIQRKVLGKNRGISAIRNPDNRSPYSLG
jgi:hypothetical protein